MKHKNGLGCQYNWTAICWNVFKMRSKRSSAIHKSVPPPHCSNLWLVKSEFCEGHGNTQRYSDGLWQSWAVQKLLWKYIQFMYNRQFVALCIYVEYFSCYSPCTAEHATQTSHLPEYWSLLSFVNTCWFSYNRCLHAHTGYTGIHSKIRTRLISMHSFKGFSLPLRTI